MIVLDASVILKWIFGNENGGNEALCWKNDHASGRETIAIPDLLFYEVANVLATKTRLSKEDAAEAFSLLWDFDLECFAFGKDEFLSAMLLSRDYAITLYDAAYIELALRLNCPFITADKKLYEKTRELKTVMRWAGSG